MALTGAVLAGDEDVETMARDGFTSLVVVAPKLEPTALLTALLPLLKPSASLAIFASSLPPLAECFQKLQVTRNFAALHVRPQISFSCALVCLARCLTLHHVNRKIVPYHSFRNSTQACSLAPKHADSRRIVF